MKALLFKPNEPGQMVDFELSREVVKELIGDDYTIMRLTSEKISVVYGVNAPQATLQPNRAIPLRQGSAQFYVYGPFLLMGVSRSHVTELNDNLARKYMSLLRECAPTEIGEQVRAMWDKLHVIPMEVFTPNQRD